MTLKQAIKAYQYPNGTVGLVENPSELTDNPIYFTADYLHLSSLLAPPTDADAIGVVTEDSDFTGYDLVTDGKLNDYIRSCETYDFGKPCPGLFNRFPDNQRRIISHDEMIGICLNDRVFAKEIVEYGKKNKWCFDNRCPNEITPRGLEIRFLSSIPFYKARAQVKLNFLDKFLYMVDCLATCFNKKGHTSGRKLLFVTFREMEKQSSWMIKFGISCLRKSLTKMYGDLSGLNQIYYNTKHPIAVYSKGVKF